MFRIFIHQNDKNPVKFTDKLFVEISSNHIQIMYMYMIHVLSCVSYQI